MSGKKWWSTRVRGKLLSDLVIFSRLSSNILLDFHDSIRVVPVKYLMYWNIPEEFFAPLRILNLSMKSFVNPFVDVALTFFNSLFNSFLFDVTSFSLLSKPALFTKLAISLLLSKFTCFNLEAKVSAVNLLHSGVVKNLS